MPNASVARLADYKSPKINSGKNYGTEEHAVRVAYSWGRHVDEAQRACDSQGGRTFLPHVGRCWYPLDAGHLQATSLLCFQAVLTKPCPCVCAFSWLLRGRQPRGWSSGILAPAELESKGRAGRQGPRRPGAGQRVLGFLPLMPLPLLFCR